jgi:predicted nucleic acid-binding protein
LQRIDVAMADCVVDTSVALKWAIQEPDSPAALKVIADVHAAGGTLHFLDIARVEAFNAIWVQYHRRLCTEPEVRVMLDDIRLAPVCIMNSSLLLNDGFDLALQYDIAVYDACFVAAVKQAGCLGVTADAPLIKKLGAAFPAIKLLKNW